jgi:spermidine synthase
MLLLLLGALALVSQIVLLRELSVAFYGIELVYLLAIASWLAGTTAGAMVAPRSLRATRRRLAWLLTAVALALPVLVAMVRASRIALGGVPGAYLPFDRQLLTLAAAMLPPSILLGLAFRWAASLGASAGRSLAAAYGLESLGSVLGGFAATLAVHSGAQTFTLALAAAGAVPAAVLASAGGRRRLAAVGVLALTGLAVWRAPAADLAMTAWSHPSVAASRDSPYSRITVTSAGSQVSIFQDDVLAFESETSGSEELGHLVALQHPAPRRALLIGGSVERIDRQLARHGFDRVDVVEIDATLVEVGRRFLGAGGPVIVADPREYVRGPGQYDVIVLAGNGPTSGQSNRLYTAEFFADCARRLSADGVLGLRLPLAENVVTPQLALRTASVVRALRSALPFVDVLPGSNAVVVASRAKLPGDPATLADRARARRLDARLVTPAYIAYVYQNDRRADLAARIEASAARPNRDGRPVCYQYAAWLWLTRFFPALVRVDVAAAAEPGSWPLALRWGGPLAIVGLLLLARRRNASRTAALAFAAGLAGMVLETVVLLDYQAKVGALFEQLGLLMMAFMLGLSAGAWGVGRATGGAGGAARVRPVTVSLLVGAGVVSAGTASLADGSAGPDLAGAAALLFVVGGLVAGLFACAGARTEAGDERAIGRLYGADVAGGCVGSLLASLVLVPFLGLAPAAWVVVGVAVLALLAA